MPFLTSPRTIFGLKNIVFVGVLLLLLVTLVSALLREDWGPAAVLAAVTILLVASEVLVRKHMSRPGRSIDEGGQL